MWFAAPQTPLQNFSTGFVTPQTPLQNFSMGFAAPQTPLQRFSGLFARLQTVLHHKTTTSKIENDKLYSVIPKGRNFILHTSSFIVYSL
jgi:hypothetical protein